MTLTDRINAFPSTPDEHGDACISRAAVLKVVELQELEARLVEVRFLASLQWGALCFDVDKQIVQQFLKKRAEDLESERSRLRQSVFPVIRAEENLSGPANE